MPADSALDPTVIDNLRQLTPPGEPDVLSQVLRIFLDETPKKVRALLEALDAGDAAQVARLAHSLKGSTGNIGASALLDVCRRIEDRAKAGDLARVSPLGLELTAELRRAEHEIAQLLQASGAGA